MIRFLTRRLARAFFTLLVLSLIVFALSRASGSPVALLLPPDVSAEDARALTQALGLDRPLYVQYGIFLKDALTGRFGKSVRGNRPVTEMFFEHLPATLKLGLVAAMVTAIIGIPLGLLTGVNRGRPIDSSVRLCSGIAQGVPNFVLAVLSVLIFAVQLKVLPAAGFGGWQHMLLPVACLVLYPLGGLVRITRTAVLDVLNQDYVVVARSKGLPERVVVLRHVLRNALIPIVSFMGVMLVNVFLTGSVVIEAVFAWPGVGYLTWNAVTTRDFPLVQGAILMLGAMVILANSAVDTVYGLLDPRVRRQRLETEPGTSWQ